MDLDVIKIKDSKLVIDDREGINIDEYVQNIDGISYCPDNVIVKKINGKILFVDKHRIEKDGKEIRIIQKYDTNNRTKETQSFEYIHNSKIIDIVEFTFETGETGYIFFHHCNFTITEEKFKILFKYVPNKRTNHGIVYKSGICKNVTYTEIFEYHQFYFDSKTKYLFITGHNGYSQCIIQKMKLNLNDKESISVDFVSNNLILNELLHVNKIGMNKDGEILVVGIPERYLIYDNITSYRILYLIIDSDLNSIKEKEICLNNNLENIDLDEYGQLILRFKDSFGNYSIYVENVINDHFRKIYSSRITYELDKLKHDKIFYEKNGNYFSISKDRLCVTMLCDKNHGLITSTDPKIITEHSNIIKFIK